MAKPVHSCPTCSREFKSVFDYPRVRVLAFERLPTPEAVDTMSAAAAEKQLARRRSEPSARRFLTDGINMTPEIDRACQMSEVSEYLEHLTALVGQELVPAQLLPLFPAHPYFKWAYPVSNTQLYLSLHESDVSGQGERTAEVQVHCDGPNMGSAGGPTLQPLGAIARLQYQGLLAPK